MWAPGMAQVSVLEVWCNLPNEWWRRYYYIGQLLHSLAALKYNQSQRRVQHGHQIGFAGFCLFGCVGLVRKRIVPPKIRLFVQIERAFLRG
jgi:hypothetical protein